MRKILVALAAVAAAVVVVIVIAEPFASNSASAAPGELRFVECFASNGEDGCAEPSPNSTILSSAQDVAVSPDGKSVYVGGGMGVSHFNRSAGGALSFADCVQNGGGNECADPSPGKTPLSGPKHLAVSPDGKSVYVSADGSNSLSRFDRNATTGALTFVDCFANAAEAAADGCTSLGNNPLSIAAQVAVSPDGENVYVTASGSDSLSRFDRKTTTGALSFAGCFANGGANGCTDPSVGDTPLDGAFDVAVSPDGKSVYVTSPGLESGSISRFNRDTTTGALGFAGCIGGGGCDESLGGDPLNGPEGLAVSPDGKNVYVAGAGADSIGTFNRATDGALTYAGCISNTGTAVCTHPSGGNPFGGAWEVAVSADGTNVILVSIDQSSVSWFNRSANGSISFSGCIADNAHAGCVDPSSGNEPLENPRGVAVSSDGKSLYVAAMTGSSVSRFAWSAPPATGDRVYWTNNIGNTISFTNLDGSGGGDLAISGTTPYEPHGVAIDSAAGRIYWADYGDNKISYANLDGSGGGNLVTTGATVFGPVGVAIDPGAGRIYWANQLGGKISFANLDGSGGGDINTTGATIGQPHGVAIDRAADRIYWANYSAGKISFANLDGSGGGDINTAGATVTQPNGVAIDAAAGRIYWANRAAGISYANVNGSGGGGNLATTGATVDGPYGLSLDPTAGRVYWGNYNANRLSYADLAGGGGGNLSTSGASPNGTVFPIVLRTPSGTGAPAISGSSMVGSTLSCSQGSWAADLLGAFLYRAPQTFAYQWNRDGTSIGGATTSSYAAAAAGQYSCTVSASNRAGTVSQTSAPFAVSERAAPPPPPSNSFSFGKVKVNKKKGTAKLIVKVPGPGKLVLSGKMVVKQSVTFEKAGNVKLLIKPKGGPKKKLANVGRAKVKVNVAYTPAGGSKRTKSKTIQLVNNLG
jgi:DNA-binding beta-propeller fold protein YncE